MKIIELQEPRNKSEEIKVTEQTAEFLKAFQRAMKSKGFERTDARLQSALFHWTFESGKRKIEISGWHGTGNPRTSRWYGDLKLLHTIYDNKDWMGHELKWKRDRIFSISTIDDTVEDHTKMLAAALSWANRL